MKIRHISILRFRGIKELDWSVPGSMVCLIGSGDSTKSTILTAIEYALSPRYSLSVYDTDFYMCDTSQPFEITVTVGQLHKSLIAEDRFGCYLRGWNESAGLRDEPDDEDELVLSIRLRVDESLEPAWEVITDRHSEGRQISSRDRGKFGVTLLGSFVDREFAWGRGAALARLTSQSTDNPDNIAGLLAEANRQARAAVSDAQDNLHALQTASQNAKNVATLFGVHARSDYHPALDALAVIVGVGSLSLHEGDVPVRLAGQGSRRLLALALQRQSVPEGAVLLVDEVEQALEPHRLRHLLRLLRPKDATGGTAFLGTETDFSGQSIITTHSPIAIQELLAHELYEVKSKDGLTSIQQVDVEALQGVVRKIPDAFLAKKVIVCEGKTEYGLCRAIDTLWSQETGLAFAYLGVVAVEGGGDEAPKNAKRLAEFGIETALVVDSDKTEINEDLALCRQAGVEVIQWAGSCSTEERICLDLPKWDDLQAILEYGIERTSLSEVIQVLASRLEVSPKDIDVNAEWLSLGECREREIRDALGKTAKRKRWFKRIDHGEWLGRLLHEHLQQSTSSDLPAKLMRLRAWIDYDVN